MVNFKAPPASSRVAAVARKGSGEMTALARLPAARDNKREQEWDFCELRGARRTMRILLIEDCAPTRDLLRRFLEGAGHRVESAARLSSASRLAAAEPFDVIVLDVMLPDGSGLDLCRELRHRGLNTPILVLSAKDAVSDRIAGLDAGADDYLRKPFALAELHARLRSLARRGRPDRPVVLTVGDLRLDPARREVRRGSVEIDLSAKEFALLETFMRRPGDVLSRLELIEHAWDFAYETRSNVVDVYVRRLRGKIDRPFGRRSIETVRGAGYRLAGDG